MVLHYITVQFITLLPSSAVVPIGAPGAGPPGQTPVGTKFNAFGNGRLAGELWFGQSLIQYYYLPQAE